MTSLEGSIGREYSARDLEQMEFVSTGNRLSAIAYCELGKKMFDMEFDRVQADDQSIRDFLV